MASGAQTRNVGSQSLDKASRLSSRLLGADVAGARDSSWVCLRISLLYLDTKHSHMRADVDGLAYHLHHPTDFG
jgi:hypothetical protein